MSSLAVFILSASSRAVERKLTVAAIDITQRFSKFPTIAVSRVYCCRKRVKNPFSASWSIELWGSSTTDASSYRNCCYYNLTTIWEFFLYCNIAEMIRSQKRREYWIINWNESEIWDWLWVSAVREYLWLKERSRTKFNWKFQFESPLECVSVYGYRWTIEMQIRVVQKFWARVQKLN